jgi:protein-arginine deiminase
VGVNISFIDDFMSHHVRGGEVHCATNSFREATTPWKVFR